MVARRLWQKSVPRTKKERAAEAALSHLRLQRLVIAKMKPAAPERTVSKPDAETEREHDAYIRSEPFCQGIEPEATEDGGSNIPQLGRFDTSRRPLPTLITTPSRQLEAVEPIQRNRRHQIAFRPHHRTVERQRQGFSQGDPAMIGLGRLRIGGAERNDRHQPPSTTKTRPYDERGARLSHFGFDYHLVIPADQDLAGSRIVKQSHSTAYTRIGIST